MKLTEICTKFNYSMIVSPAEYEWGGRELHINVVPHNGKMPTFVIGVIKGVDGTILVENITVHLNTSIMHTYGMKESEYAEYVRHITNGEVVRTLLDKVDWASEFEAIWDAETEEMYYQK